MATIAPSARGVTSARVLHREVVASMRAYRRLGGGTGLRQARRLDPGAVVDLVEASGLRGRGGAGFPAGRKWRTVAGEASAGAPATVVVNGAEGEPWTFKDRTILRRNPFQVVEGALIAARAVGATRVVVALKASFVPEVQRVRGAIEELRAAGLLDDTVPVEVFEGPDEYLFGEESALLEAIEGRGTFPRIVPPYRRRGPAGPALVNNVETLANVPRILARGPAWFRSIGTEASPGTVVCTVTGDVRRQAVGEVRLGTPLRQVLRAVGGGPRPGRPVKAVLSGVANGVVTADHLDAPVSHDGLQAVGSGLGAAGFAVFDRGTDMVAVAAGVARFLAVESCGQCSPCKLDGATIAGLLAKLATSQAHAADLVQLERRVGTVAYGARCYLGVQQEVVTGSILRAFRPEFEAHVAGTLPPAPPLLVAELLELEGGVAVHDEGHAAKQLDWSFDRAWSGTAPVDLRRGPVPR